MMMNMDGVSWIWVTGEEFEYENWYPGEPSSPGEENCVNYEGDGRWNDSNCDSYFRFIVEIPHSEPPSLGAVEACHPYHVDNGYSDNFFGVSPDLQGVINSGDMLFVTQGDHSYYVTVMFTTFTGDENCVDEYGRPNYNVRLH